MDITTINLNVIIATGVMLIAAFLAYIVFYKLDKPKSSRPHKK